MAPLIYCLFIFISIYLIIDLFGNLDEIIRSGMGVRMLMTYYFIAYLPSIMVQAMPIAVLIATMYTLGDFAMHNEITAFRASGVGLWNILKPFLITGLLISAFIFIINDAVVPSSTQLLFKIREEKLENKKPKSGSNKIIKNVALYGQGNKLIYARSYDSKTAVLKDIVIQEQDRRQNIIAKTTAKEARWTREGWIAFNITSYKLNREGEIKEEPVFQHRGLLSIKESPEEFYRQRYKTEILTMSELRSSLKRLAGTNSLMSKNLLIESYNRTAQPLANFIAVLIGAAFCIRSRRSSRLLGVGIGFLIGFFFYGFSAVTIALGRGGLLPPFLAAWSSNILFGWMGIYFINKY